jgi:hypothetical protein
MSVPPAISDAVRAGRRAKRRGKRGELEAISKFKTFWPRARRNLEQPQMGRDMLDGPEGTRVSIKYTERLKLRETYAECEFWAKPALEIPIVVHRCNSQPWLATLPLDELMPLLVMRERG